MANHTIKSFGVIGLGRFGYNLAVTLAELGHDVICVDGNQDVVDEIIDKVTYAVCADVSVEGALDGLGLANTDAVVIGLASNLNAAIMATIECKDMNVPHIICKAKNEMHARILKKLGADHTIIPEMEVGIKLAHTLSNRSVYEYIELSEEHSLVDIAVPKAWYGKTLNELNVRSKFGVSIVGILNQGYTNINPTPVDKFREGDHVLALGLNTDLEKLEDHSDK